jgi:tetratricopeptide (TPR) repeat protein
MNTAPLETTADDPCPDSGVVDAGSGVRARPLALGTVVANRYVIRGKLGQGGFAVVYDAEHLGLARSVAIKVVHVDDDMPVGLLERSRREARHSALVRHPNVLEVFDTGTLEDGSPYLVMERIEGETLSKRIARQRLSIPAVVELGRQLLLALEALAAHALIHRDIKPENVMLHDAGDGRLIVKVVDFGIAKRTVPGRDVRLTREGTLVGTPSYMSPEQLRGEELDERTDLYSTGAVLYEALTGRPPHDRTSLEELMLAALHDKVRPVRVLRPGCPRELERIVLKALSRARDDRYPSARAMRLELEQCAEACGLPTASKAWRVVEPVEDYKPAWPRLLTHRASELWNGLLDRAPASRPLQAALALLFLLMGGGGAQLVPHHTTAATIAPNSPPIVQPLVTPRVELLPVRGEDEPHLLKLDRAAAATEGGPRDVATRERRSRRHRGHDTPRIDASAAESVSRAEAPVLAIRTAPSQSTRARLDEALTAYTFGRYALADQLYRKVLAADPHELTALRGLGLVAARRGNHAEARALLERYLSLAPSAPDAQLIRARLAALSN